MRRFTKQLNEREQELIHKHYKFYHALETGVKEPETKEQEHFVLVCQGKVEPKTEHEIVYIKYLTLRKDIKVEESEKEKRRKKSGNIKPIDKVSLNKAYQKIFDILEHIKNENEKEHDIIKAANILADSGIFSGRGDLFSHLYQLAEELDDPWEKIYTFMEITDAMRPKLNQQELNFDEHYREDMAEF